MHVPRQIMCTLTSTKPLRQRLLPRFLLLRFSSLHPPLLLKETGTGALQFPCLSLLSAARELSADEYQHRHVMMTQAKNNHQSENPSMFLTQSCHSIAFRPCFPAAHLHEKINSAQNISSKSDTVNGRQFSRLIKNMPFIGQDWRSPGDQWVRTTEGWERLRLWRLKVFENLNENVLARLIRLALTMDVGPHRQTMARTQPYVTFNKATTRERKELTSLSEALLRLDMAGAVKDIRRSNFVCKLLEMILEQKIANLSGTAQKHIFHILEATVTEALRTELNLGFAKKLLSLAQTALNEGQHYHIGSQNLWGRHNATVCRLNDRISAYQLKQREEDNKVTLLDLPDDCLRNIFFCIADHSDIIHAGQSSRSLHDLSQETLLWRQMCFFHFSHRQILTFLPASVVSGSDGESERVDWKYVYRRCYKRFGKKDAFADMLAMCSHCCSIYWQSLGHPCISDAEKKEKLLSPEDFIKLFPL